MNDVEGKYYFNVLISVMLAESECISLCKYMLRLTITTFTAKPLQKHISQCQACFID